MKQKMNTISVRQYLVDRYSQNGIIDFDKTLTFNEIQELLFIFGNEIVEKQIVFSAVGAAHQSAKMRGTYHQLQNDLETHLNVCKVNITK